MNLQNEFHYSSVQKRRDYMTSSRHLYTLRFFQILDLSKEFLKVDPSEWKRQESYLKNQKVATSVKVVNDLAERGVALVQEFNASLTRNEEQKRISSDLVVENHRHKFGVPTKAEAIKESIKTCINCRWTDGL